MKSSPPPPASVSPIDYKPPVSSPMLHASNTLPSTNTPRRPDADVWSPANPMFQPMTDLSMSSCMQRSPYGLHNGQPQYGQRAYNSYYSHHQGNMDSAYTTLPNMQLPFSSSSYPSTGGGNVSSQHAYQMSSGYGTLPSANTLARPNTHAQSEVGDYINKEYVRLF